MQLSIEDEKIRWKLLECLILEYLKNRFQILNVQNLLVEFKKKRVHPHHDEFVLITEVCLRMLDTESTITTEELSKLVECCYVKTLCYIG
jgi:hypothetical protein